MTVGIPDLPETTNPNNTDELLLNNNGNPRRVKVERVLALTGLSNDIETRISQNETNISSLETTLENITTNDLNLSDLPGILNSNQINDGPGSGLNADLLDGIQATEFATSNQGQLADSALQPEDFDPGSTLGDLFRNASNLTTGTLALERLPSQVALLSDIDNSEDSNLEKSFLWINSRQDISSKTISSDIESIKVLGYANPGDGGSALFIKVTSEPSHVGKEQSADGAWWELRTSRIVPEIFGAVGDGVTDDTAAFNDLSSYLLVFRDMLVDFNGKHYVISKWEYPDRTSFRNGTLIAASGQNQNDFWLCNLNRASSTAGREAKNVSFENVVFDGTNLPFSRWLSKIDGTPITDPEADYIMGTGALASGISGVSLTANLSGNSVSSVTINNGGSGWNSHPIYPYIPDEVALKFTGGGGSGAEGYAKINSGTLTSVVITDGGTGYTSPPTVTTIGGYADIELLVQSSVNRRNFTYSSANTGDGIVAQKVVNANFIRCTFKNIHRTVLVDLGCLNFTTIECLFTNCGKDDGAFPCIYTKSFGNPNNPLDPFADSEGFLSQDCRFESPERSAYLFGTTKGGSIIRPIIVDAGESSIFCSSDLNMNGGKSVIEGGKIYNGIITDIVGMSIEALAVENLTVRGVDIRGSAKTISASGGRNCIWTENTFTNCVTGKTKGGEDYVYPYGPFGERYEFNQGKMTKAGTAFNRTSLAVMAIGAGTSGSQNTRIMGNTFKETRPADLRPGYIFRQYKAGTSLTGGDTIIENNEFTNANGLELLNTDIANVWKPVIPLHIRNNIGHVSSGPITFNVVHSIGESGVREINSDFRPSKVMVYCSGSAPVQSRGWIGELNWVEDNSTDGGGIYINLGGYLYNYDSDFVRIVSDDGTRLFGAEFLKWKELGFEYNIVQCDVNVKMRIICFP